MSENHKPHLIDGHRLTEFIYGTVTALVAVAGIDVEHLPSWYTAALMVITGGVAIWLAHAYATLMSNRITSGKRIDDRAIAESLYSSWPIVTAAILVSLPFIGAAVSLYPVNMAVWLANIVGVLILLLVGIAAGSVAEESWSRRVLLATISVGLGLLIVTIKLAIPH